jgi:hypothetical protein
VDLSRPAQLGRALTRLGIEHIPSYSRMAAAAASGSTAPCKAGSSTSSAWRASPPSRRPDAYLREHFIADYDAQFTCPPADPDPAFVALWAVDLDVILCQEEERTVGLDNVVVLEGVPLQLSTQPPAAPARGSA